MESKTLNFHIFRYHLLPNLSEYKQTVMFEEHELTVSELKEKKNYFFEIELDSLQDKKNSHPLKLHYHEGNFYIFKFANKKKVSLIKDFKPSTVDNWPYVYIIINNDPNVQKIAISENSEAFSKPNVVQNIISKLFKRDLEKYSLNIEIEQMFDAVEFWKFVMKHKESLTAINFKFIKPNLANISKSLPEAFKAFSEKVNSHESNIILKAPENGILDNINEDNTEIKGLVNYAAEGGGNIRMKVKKLRKQVNTKEGPVIVKADDIIIEGAADQVVKAFKSIVE